MSESAKSDPTTEQSEEPVDLSKGERVTREGIAPTEDDPEIGEKVTRSTIGGGKVEKVTDVRYDGSEERTVVELDGRDYYKADILEYRKTEVWEVVVMPDGTEHYLNRVEEDDE